MLIADYGYISLNKINEELCGDKVEIIKNDNCLTMVLADGLGSGVKANILATLTSKILVTLISNGISIEEAADVLLETLPVCKVRNIAYSTFSICSVIGDIAHIMEFDNPNAILIRDGLEYPYERIERVIGNKKIYESFINYKENDCIIFLSDGVVHAGIGKTMNFGFTRKELVDYIIKTYNDDKTAKEIVLEIAEICDSLYQHEPGDDTTASCIKFRKDDMVNIMIGPPMDKNLDNKVINKFLSKQGEKIVCGGTTANIVSKYLHEEIIVNSRYYDLEIPPIADINGIDLVTEGILTLKKAVEILKNWTDSKLIPEFTNKKDGASLLITKIIKSGMVINIFVGRAINQAHQDQRLEIDFNTKLHLIEEFVSLLKKIGKEVNVEYY